MKSLIIRLCAVSIATTALGQGTILWNEGVDGPFSNFSDNPTVLPPLQLGTNSTVGATEIEPNGNIWTVYEDFFTFTVPANAMVASVYFQVDKPQVQTWIGNQSFSSQLAVMGNPIAGELLAQWGTGSLPSAGYGLYLANHDAQSSVSIANYRLDFFVQSVPEPDTLALAFVGAAGFVGLRCTSRYPRRKS